MKANIEQAGTQRKRAGRSSGRLARYRKTMAVLGMVAGAFLLLNSFKKTSSGIDDDNPSSKCVSCHQKTGNGRAIVEQWRDSKHYKKGVGCLDCHGVDKARIDGFEHHGERIATIVTPDDCAMCHKKETGQFAKSHHADAAMILGSLDNVLAEVVEGHTGYNKGANPAAANGCWQCHGSKVELLRDAAGKVVTDTGGVPQYDPKTWPNSGIGRINLDGSKGSCAACHNRHNFSSAQARQPDNCGKCHLGPDHPQMEIYTESKHGINYLAHKDSMHLTSEKWIVGVDYSAAPTCATCHMSATPNMEITHDVGDRISWTLRPPVSQKIDAAMKSKYEKMGKPLPPDFLSADQRRISMKDVCSQCHTKNFVEDFYTQYDNQVNLYNDKFGIPATKIYTQLKSEGLLTAVDFDEKIEWTYYYLWHHEGRRSRMGASMMGPDYTQWHGNYEVADRFYSEFIPQVKEIIEQGKKNGKKESAEKAERTMNDILNTDMHKWYLGKMDPAEEQKRKEDSKKFRERYEK
jgi:hydroxylamine dehydrogenase